MKHTSKLFPRDWRYRFNWRITLFSLVCIVIFLNLSRWQVERAGEKEQLQTVYNLRRSAPPVTLSALTPDNRLNGSNVQLAGYFDNEHSFLLDNRVLDGKVGYEVITPLRLVSDGEWAMVLVNRGWLEMGRTRDMAVDIATFEGLTKAYVWIYVPEGEMFSLASELTESGWPRTVQQVDVSSFIAELKTAEKIFPHLIRLDQSSIGALPRNWPVVNMRPEKHTGYAVQWFIMALAVLVAYCWVSIEKIHRRES